MISITAAIFSCQLVICDVTSCGNNFYPECKENLLPDIQWFELVENIEARMIDGHKAEVRRIDKPDIIWYINDTEASYGWNDEFTKMTIYRKK